MFEDVDEGFPDDDEHVTDPAGEDESLSQPDYADEQDPALYDGDDDDD